MVLKSTANVWLSFTYVSYPFSLCMLMHPFRSWGFFILAMFWSCCSVTKLCWTLQPHGLQHARLPCPSLSPRACSNSCPLSQWCHPTISSSVTLFSSCSQNFPASRSFPVSWLFTSGGQSSGLSCINFPTKLSESNHVFLILNILKESYCNSAHWP